MFIVKVEISIFHWVKLLLAGGAAPVILYVGVRSLINAYDITHPQIFIMYFFSASFIILTGLTLLAYFVCQLWYRRAKRPTLPSFED